MLPIDIINDKEIIPFFYTVFREITRKKTII